MKRVTDLQLDKAAMLKAARSAVRLKYSLMADAELARVLPDLEERIDLAWANQTPLELNVGDVFNETGWDVA
jgi:hypothetical protein